MKTLVTIIEWLVITALNTIARCLAWVVEPLIEEWLREDERIRRIVREEMAAQDSRGTKES